MMRNALLGLIAGGVLLVSSSAMAITYTDNNPADVYLNYLNPSYTGQFNLTDYGYNPLTEQVDSAVIVFTLWDAALQESWQIQVEGQTLFNGGSFSGFLYPGTSVTGSLLGNLDADGILNYTVSVTSGGYLDAFWLNNANLTAQSSPRQESAESNVPDGGTTAALLGLGLVGCAGLRKRLARA